MPTHVYSKLALMQTFIITTMAVVCLIAVPARADLGDELFKLTASDAAAGDTFGYSVAISGNTAIVSAPWDSNVAGSAYLYDVTTGQELTKLSASDAMADDAFGYSVGISDNAVIVGAPAVVIGRAGSAYLFDEMTGQERFKLIPSDSMVDDSFGAAVAISGNTALVGAFAHGTVPNVVAGSGSAYLFDVTTGQQLLKLTASDAEVDDDWFGRSVAISGNIALVGSPQDSAPYFNSGSAYLFDVTSGQELFKLAASDAAFEDEFGWSVAISGNVAIVGSRLGGSAYLFDVTTGQQLFKLTASDAAGSDYFGRSVAINGNVAIVGAPWDNAAAGSVYLFDATSGEQLAKLTASDAAVNDLFLFGSSVALSGNTALVGALGDRFGTGSAYVFSAVPEPASVLLVALGLPLLDCRNLVRKTERKIS